MSPQFPQQQPDSSQYLYQQPQQTQQYAPPPIMPPSKRPWYKRTWTWYRTRPRRTQIIIAAVIILFIAFGGIISALTPQAPSQDRTPAPTQQAAEQNSQPTQAPTQAAQSTATTSSSSNIKPTNGTPHIGGPLSDFVGAYGQPGAHSSFSQGYDVLHLLPSSTSNVDGLIVASEPGDTTYLAADITVQATNGNAQTEAVGWTADDAKARCMTFAPADAHFKQQFVYTNNSGYDLVYTSAELAKDFSAADFTDQQQNQVQAGMFDVSYLYASDSQHIGSCDMIIGEQQTTG